MDKASAYGAGDCRFESCRGHLLALLAIDVYQRLDAIISLIISSPPSSVGRAQGP